MHGASIGYDRKMRNRLIGFFLVVLVAVLPAYTIADTVADLQKSIDTHNAQIDALNKEIAQYEAQLKATTGKKQTLQNAIAALKLQRNKITASINVTKNQIASTQLQIQQLASTITTKQQNIASDKAAIAEGLRVVQLYETQPLVAQVLSGGSVADVWRNLEDDTRMQAALAGRIQSLASEKKQLDVAKQDTQSKQDKLVAQKNTLVTQQGSLDATTQSQNKLLAETKSQESAYQTLIKQKKAQQASFENALADLKSKLAVAVNPSQITAAGHGILQWPVDSVNITQYFGNTAFAASGAYNGKGHNGIDLAASVGTPIRSALAGTVIGTGNTDAVRGCYSFGKWVMVKHANGLSTMYAHLSVISVSQGAQVDTGQLLGYSGETGYATGPHLHFGVYVSSATQIMRLGDATNSKTPCSSAVMPVAPLAGYLNPMNYL